MHHFEKGFMKCIVVLHNFKLFLTNKYSVQKKMIKTKTSVKYYGGLLDCTLTDNETRTALGWFVCLFFLSEGVDSRKLKG